MKKRELKDKVIDLQKQLTELKDLHTALGKAYEIKINTCQLLRATNIDLQNRIKELESSKPTLGEALLGVESEGKEVYNTTGWIIPSEVPISIRQKHGKEIESLISTLERCKSERKRFEYELEFFDSEYILIVSYFGKDLFQGLYSYQKIEGLISALIPLFLSETVNENLLNLMFKRIDSKWFASENYEILKNVYKTPQYKYRFFSLLQDEGYFLDGGFNTISELETILIENEISF